MADTVNLPGIGKTPKTTAYMLGGGLVLIVGVAWYRSRNAGAAPAIAPAPDPTVPDQTAAAPIDTSGGGGGGGNYGGTPTWGNGVATGVYTSNAQWSQAAEDYLVNSVGQHADVVGHALGKYITGQALAAAQVPLVEQAIAFTGYPPVNGPSGYPPSYRTATAVPPPPTKPPNKPPNKPPVVTPHAPTKLRATHIYRTQINLDWSPVAGAVGYHVYKDGHQVGPTVTYSQFAVTGLKPGTRHRFDVRAIGHTGHLSGKSNSITVATHRK